MPKPFERRITRQSLLLDFPNQESKTTKARESQSCDNISNESGVKRKVDDLGEFKPNPFARNDLDYRVVAATLTYEMKKRQHLKAYKKHLTKHKMPFFPNTTDSSPPAPSSSQLQYQRPPITDTPAIQQLTTLTIPPISSVSSILLFDQRLKIILMTFFGNLCTSLVMNAQKCNQKQCLSSHKLPSAQYLEQQLIKNSKSDTEEVYSFVTEFPVDLCVQFFPAFPKVLIQRNHFCVLKQMIKDCCNLQIDIKFIADELVAQGWDVFKATKFINEALV